MNKELLEITTGLRRTLHLIHQPEKKLLIVASGIMIVTGILTNLPAVILGQLVDKLITTTAIKFSYALPFIISIIIIILIREALTVLRKYLVENVATQAEKKQTVNVISHLLKTELASINQQQIGSLHGRIFRSIQGLVKIIKLGFLDFFPIFFSALAALAIAFYRKPLLAGIMILVVPAGLLIIIKQISSQKGIRISLLRGKEEIDGRVVEMLSGIETVRALDTNDYETLRVEQVAENLRKKEIKHHISMALFDAGKYLNEGFFYIIVISLSIFFSAQGLISRGDILVYSILFLSITGPLREIHRILDEAHESSIRVNDLYGLINQPLDSSYEIASPQVAPNLNENEIIKIEQLSFYYPNKNNQNILNNINLTINQGEKVGIVGTSGCGKSTLIKILLRLIHGYSGTIKIFGVNLSSLSREEIASEIAYVPQKTYIFSGTVKENIIYGCQRQNITDEEVILAAKMANIYEEINESLGGLLGYITENGNNLSGGQKQRLAIARIILKSPKILIFDEATSALDNINEVTIQQHLEKYFKNSTIITIAHRLTTLKNTNQILVMDKGKIVQTGTFDQLANQPGLFQDFLKQKENDTLITK
ncbi:MAG: ABC transporter ATP-binding protein [Patescibacteria group bacterium]